MHVLLGKKEVDKRKENGKMMPWVGNNTLRGHLLQVNLN